jgi:hypothetical protein
MKTVRLAEFEASYSHGQLLIYDASVSKPCLEWTETHVDQGFARRTSALCLSMILDAGDADVTAYLGPYVPSPSHQRAVAVPFHSPTGRVIVEGMIVEIYCARVLFVQPGHYRLTAAQQVVGDINDEEAEDCTIVELYFEPVKTPLSLSAVLKADAGMKPPPQLLEDADEIE